MNRNTPANEEWGNVDARFKRSKWFLYLILPILFFSIFTASVLAQSRTVTGVVKDETGAAMQGVSVVVKGSEKGVTSAADGSFSIQVPANNKLLV